METKTALVARTQFIADRIVRLTGMDAFPIGVGGATTGRRFDKIVVVSLATPQEQADLAHMERVQHWIDTSLRTKLPPNGSIHFLD